MRWTVFGITGLGASLFVFLAFAGPVEDFLASDANKNNLLEAEEFSAFVKLRAKAGSASAKQVTRLGAYRIALSRVDYDKDGKVSGDELRRFDREN